MTQPLGGDASAVVELVSSRVEQPALRPDLKPVVAMVTCPSASRVLLRGTSARARSVLRRPSCEGVASRHALARRDSQPVTCGPRRSCCWAPSSAGRAASRRLSSATGYLLGALAAERNYDPGRLEAGRRLRPGLGAHARRPRTPSWSMPLPTAFAAALAVLAPAPRGPPPPGRGPAGRPRTRPCRATSSATAISEALGP